MADAHVDVGTATETRSDVVDVVVHVLVNTSLEAKRTDDARVVVFLTCFDEFLSELKRLLEEGFSDGGGVVANHGHFWNLLVDWHRHLLRCWETNMSVKRGFKSPVDAE